MSQARGEIGGGVGGGSRGDSIGNSLIVVNWREVLRQYW